MSPFSRAPRRRSLADVETPAAETATVVDGLAVASDGRILVGLDALAESGLDLRPEVDEASAFLEILGTLAKQASRREHHEKAIEA